MSKIPESVFLAKGSIVVGNVTIGENCSIWYNTVVRGDENVVVIGDNTNVQDLAMIHTSEHSDCRIGSGVSIGHCAIVHGCTVGDNTLIGMGAILMNDVVVGENSIIGAGAVVTAGTVIPPGSVVVGNPAKIRRSVTESEIEYNKNNALGYIELAANNRAWYN